MFPGLTKTGKKIHNPSLTLCILCVCVLSSSTPAVQARQTENHTLAIIGDERNALILKIGTKVSTETRWLLHLLCGLGLFLTLKLITLGLWSIWACHSFLCWAEHIWYVLSECLLLLSKETAFEQLLPASLVPHLTCSKIIIFKFWFKQEFQKCILRQFCFFLPFFLVWFNLCFSPQMIWEIRSRKLFALNVKKVTTSKSPQLSKSLSSSSTVTQCVLIL